MKINLNLLPEDQRGSCPKDITFGASLADHMFTQIFKADLGWHEAQIKPTENISLSPAATVLHYAQEIFEGLKAYRQEGGNIALFRPDRNADRFNRSAHRMCMPQVEKESHLEAICRLVTTDKAWIPGEPGSALYIRPTMIATSAKLGLGASDDYLHFIITSPVGPYFKQGFTPISVFVSDTYRRAVVGGIGEAKTGGNYAASLYVGEQVARKGYSQVLWLDALEGRYIEEVGAMNICLVYRNGTIKTPTLSGSILPGITRESILTLAPHLNHPIEETKLDINDVLSDIKSGKITEVFGCGTAAAIAPIGCLAFKDEDYVINNNQTGPVTKSFFQALTDIQYGRAEDTFGWIVKV